MKLFIFSTIMIFLLFGQLCALSFGNPADLPPKKSIEVSAELGKKFLFSKNNAHSNKFVPHQFFLRLGYTPYKWIQLFGCIGASDADWYWRPGQIPNEIYLDGTWELSAGGGAKILPPVKFNGLGFKWHVFVDGSYVFIRSRYPEYTLPSGLWTLKMKSHINQVDIGGFIVGYNRRFNLSFYGGLAGRYISSIAVYTAISSKGDVYHGDLLLGSSFGSESILTMAFYPVVGANWHIDDNLAFDFEFQLLDLGNSGTLIGFSLGISHYK